MDAVNRRMGHTVINIFRIVFYVYLCDTNQLRLKTALLQLPVIRLSTKELFYMHECVLFKITQRHCCKYDVCDTFHFFSLIFS